MTSEFHVREFNSMLFNPIQVPDGADVLKLYKDLAKYKEFKLNPGEGIDKNKVLLYIFSMYDLHSPYRKKYDDVRKRKIAIAHDVKFPMDEEGRFASPIEDLLQGKNEKVNRMIVAYVRMHRNFKYSYLVSLEASYYGMLEGVIAGDNTKVKTIKEAQEELEETLMDVLAGDNNIETRKELLQYMEDERLGLRPEDIAQKMRDGRKPV